MNKKQKLVNTVMVGFLIFVGQNTLYGASSIGKAIELFGKKEELKYTHQAKTASLGENTPLYYSDGVSTGPNSSTRLLFEDPTSKIKAAFYVFENSKFTLDKEVVEAGGKKITVKHTQGALSLFVKGLKKGDELQIVTSYATLGVRGTGLYIEYSPNYASDNTIYATVSGSGEGVYLGNERLKSGIRYTIVNNRIVGREASSYFPQHIENMGAVNIVEFSPIYRMTDFINDAAKELRRVEY